MHDIFSLGGPESLFIFSVWERVICLFNCTMPFNKECWGIFHWQEKQYSLNHLSKHAYYSLDSIIHMTCNAFATTGETFAVLLRWTENSFSAMLYLFFPILNITSLWNKLIDQCCEQINYKIQYASLNLQLISASRFCSSSNIWVK